MMQEGEELHEEARQLIRPVTLAEVKQMLQEAQDEFQELTYEQKLALKHAQEFSKLSIERVQDLIKDLTEVPIITEAIAYKIADIMPEHTDDIHLLFSKQRTQLTAEDISSIIEIVDKYREE
jgi:DNA-directed RNA polymerase subunit F